MKNETDLIRMMGGNEEIIIVISTQQLCFVVIKQGGIMQHEASWEVIKQFDKRPQASVQGRSWFVGIALRKAPRLYNVWLKIPAIWVNTIKKRTVSVRGV